MERWQKITTTLWTTVLSGPVLLFLYAFSQLECGELDPCPTGGAMPNSGFALVLLATILVLQGFFLKMIWTLPEPDDGLDPGSTFFTEADREQSDAGSHPA